MFTFPQLIFCMKRQKLTNAREKRKAKAVQYDMHANCDGFLVVQGKLSILAEHDGFVLMHEDAILNMPFHCACQYNSLNRAADALQLPNVITMADALNVLLNNWAAIQLFRYVMGCSADDLHAAIISLRVWLASDEGGQEGMVDINNAVPVRIDQSRRQDLHISGQYNQVYFSINQLQLLLLGLSFGVRGNRNMIERNSERFDIFFIVRMVADDHGNFRI
ncbi:hypothetical protein D3C77_548140 [compost metagenome]